jgi:hypothetical protein
MYQRKCVYELNACAERQHGLKVPASGGAESFQRQNRAYPLPGAQHRIAHGCRQHSEQNALNRALPVVKRMQARVTTLKELVE